MSTIEIRKTGILDTEAEAVVNAANEWLQAGGGVCGVIFSAAGMRQLQQACDAIGHCDTGSAVITPGFNLKAKYIIHAVGPQWRGGDHHEPQQLYGCYRKSLELAGENGIRSVCFPLISSGIFGYPVDKAWRKALQACLDYISRNPEHDVRIIFAIPGDSNYELGLEIYRELTE